MLSFVEFNLLVIKVCIKDIVFVIVIDGNYGCGVVWVVEQFGLCVVVYMLKGLLLVCVQNICWYGVECMIIELNYDDIVWLVVKIVCEQGWVLFQDIVWQGYEQIFIWIM